MVRISLIRGWVCSAVLMVASTALALITGNVGNSPVGDQNWPAGSVEVANLKTRVGYWEGPPFGGGQYRFLYRGTTADFQTALDTFASIDAPGLLLVVTQGPGEDWFLRSDPKGGGGQIDWAFTVWNPESWNRLYNDPKSTFGAMDPSGRYHQPVEPPTLQVYVAGEGAGGIDFTQVYVPPKVKVKDTRATADGYKAADASVIRGRVSGMSVNKPLAGAEVVVGSRTQQVFTKVASATSDAEGRFEMLRLAPGSYEMRAEAKGYAPRSLGYCTLTKNSLEELAVSLSPVATISGTVVDMDGKPVAGVTVRVDNVIASDGKGYLLPERHQVTTDAGGRFTFDDLPHGDMQLFAYDKTHLVTDLLKRYAAPSDDISLQVVTTGGVKGKVISQGKPSSNTVSIVPEGGEKVGKWSGSRRIEPDGTFQFDGVPPGWYTVSADVGEVMPGKPGRTAKTIEIKPGEMTEVILESPAK